MYCYSPRNLTARPNVRLTHCEGCQTQAGPLFTRLLAAEGGRRRVTLLCTRCREGQDEQVREAIAWWLPPFGRWAVKGGTR